MEDASDRDRVASATVMEDSSDAVLSRLFGASLQAATLRSVIYLAVLSAIVATLARLV
ncbi:MAG TPA: hypothetical protein VJ747_18875 [Stellaceae bacterium]|nr:hypothetical protein [Stellaceae bacterium]